MATSVSAMFIIAEPRSRSTEKIAAEIEQLVLRLEELEATPAAEAVGARGASPPRWAWPPAVPPTTCRARRSCSELRRPARRAAARCAPASSLSDNRRGIRSMPRSIPPPRSSTRRSWSSPTLFRGKPLCAHQVPAACAGSFPSEHTFHTE